MPRTTPWRVRRLRRAPYSSPLRSLAALETCWEKETIHRPAPVQNFSLQKENGVHRGKISVVDMVFIGFFVSTIGLESSSLQPEKFPKRFCFGGGRVRFLLRSDMGPVIREKLKGNN